MKVGQVDLKKEFYKQMVDVQLTDFVQSKNLKKDLELSIPKHPEYQLGNLKPNKPDIRSFSVPKARMTQGFKLPSNPEMTVKNIKDKLAAYL
jgi:hypothetical protein